MTIGECYIGNTNPCDKWGKQDEKNMSSPKEGRHNKSYTRQV